VSGVGLVVEEIELQLIFKIETTQLGVRIGGQFLDVIGELLFELLKFIDDFPFGVNNFRIHCRLDALLCI
jgi:hypothetical protein